MSSATSPVRVVLEGYVAGRVHAERVVAAVAEAYYGERGQGMRETLRPLIEIIERAHPGVVELAGTAAKPGFGVRLAERPFPQEFEPALRAAVEAVLVPRPSSPAIRPGLFSRLYTAVRRLFTASA